MLRNKARKRKTQNRSLLPGLLASFLHPQPAAADSWRWLPWLLAAAFILRTATALSGDFVMHPDEIMQYLEPAHRLVFGSGIVYWEYFYGARSWLVPGLVAGVLWLCKIFGFGESLYYIAAVKIMFCAISLLVPWGMYVFGRQHWGEQTARLALLLGVFWYELVGFAHKPMTEFIATSLLLALLALMSFDKRGNWRKAAAVGALGVIIIAIRIQYAPLVGVILLACLGLFGNRQRLALIGGAATVLAAVAALETATWGKPFHSYHMNVMVNLIVGKLRTDESSLVYIPVWLLHGSGGLIAAALYGACTNFYRRGFVLVLILLVLLPHILQHHREYRFVFALIPLWLLLFADVAALSVLPRLPPAVTNLFSRAKFAAIFSRHREKIPAASAVAAGVAAVVSLLGIFNQIPLQHRIYLANSAESRKVNFILKQDPMFAAYRYLNAAESVGGVIDSSRRYHNTGGYYYLNRNIPFYGRQIWGYLFDGKTAARYATHIITNLTVSDSSVITYRNQLFLKIGESFVQLPVFAYDSGEKQLAYWNKVGTRHHLPGYKEVTRFGGLRLWKTTTEMPVREWERYQVVITTDTPPAIIERVQGSAPPPAPPNFGIKFK